MSIDRRFQAALQLAQQGQLLEARTALEELIATAPKDARVRNALGVLRLETGAVAKAIDILAPLAKEQPTAYPVHLNLGNALVAARRAPEALPILSRVARGAPSAASWYALGRAQQIAGEPAQAITSYREAQKFEPDHVEAAANLSAALAFVERYADAIAAADHALLRQPAHAGAHFNKAVALLATGEWKAGWQEWEWRERTALLQGQMRRWPSPRWQGENLAGKTLLAHAEQGYGDTLQFVRYVPVLRAMGARVILHVPAALVALLQGAGIADLVVANGEALPEHDYEVPLPGLPRRLALESDEEVILSKGAYLEVHTRAPILPARPAGVQLRVGVVWSGSATHVNDMHRSCPVSALAPLLAVSQVEWVVLQQGAAAVDLDSLREAAGGRVLVPALSDFSVTAAVLREVELVISIDSAVAHLAGALGVPCWTMLPHIGLDWRWGGTPAGGPSDCRWYGSLALWRQQTAGNWSEVVHNMSALIAGSLSH